MNRYLQVFTLCMLSFFSPLTFSEEKTEVEAEPKFSYFTLEPDIITNYITSGAKIGFIDVQVDLMMDDKSLLDIVEYHQPLIRDTIITVLSQTDEEKIKSLAGRETIRKLCLDKVNEVLAPEVEIKQKVVSDLLFTKYLYQ